MRPTPEQLDSALDTADKYGHCWVNGHHYVERKLIEVRCIDHEPRWDWGSMYG